MLAYHSLRSQRFRGAKSEERSFRRFARAKNGAACNCTETLATQAKPINEKVETDP